MSTTPTLEAASTSALPAAAVRRYRFAVLLLVVALAASIAAVIYLAVGPSSSSGTATTPVPAGPSQVDFCYRPAVPC